MSLLPSPLKSPVPTMDQTVGAFPTNEGSPGFKTLVPFISQITTSPLVSRHRMSLLPSPLKSPIPTMDQTVGAFPTNEGPPGFKTLVPCISQLTTSPLVSRQRMSLLPSPLKSPVPTIDQTVGAFPTNEGPPGFKTVVPFISQITTSPLVSRQRMPLWPSPLKSPAPTIDQTVGAFPTNGG